MNSAYNRDYGDPDVIYEVDYDQVFLAKVVGVTFRNRDGSCRQEILSRCRAGEKVQLLPEPDNPADTNAIAVVRENGEQIGYLESKLRRPIAGRIKAMMESGDDFQAVIERILDGPQKGIKGCVVAIRIG